ncbi:hypothetical protein BASA60_006179 [Batrachochytrium salamandrivorans]|nr:hypothetical protein BASA60_006179 [Batrachochytrium salamandrivorans]KAH9254975.1 hypothetical protein BASA81_007043 [Batrachochytrium salamandrivorans]
MSNIDEVALQETDEVVAKGVIEEQLQYDKDTALTDAPSVETNVSQQDIPLLAIRSHPSLASEHRVASPSHLPPLPNAVSSNALDSKEQIQQTPPYKPVDKISASEYNTDYALKSDNDIVGELYLQPARTVFWQRSLTPVDRGPTAESEEECPVDRDLESDVIFDSDATSQKLHKADTSLPVPMSAIHDVNVDTNNVDDVGDEDETALLDASHPLMKRVQAAIHTQLSTYMRKLELEIREKEEMCHKEIKRREESGVELYALQQQLVRMQAMLEGTQDNFAVIRSLREEGDRSLKHTSTEYKREQEKYHLQSKNLEKHKIELEKISWNLRQVDLYNEDLRSRILVVKRSTLKAEGDILKQEIAKNRQDYFIDRLSEQLRKLQERRTMYESQLQAQQRETKAATNILQDATTEMEAIQFEKRQLLNQWKSSLIGLQRRDDVLSQIEKDIQKNNEAIESMSREISGFKRALRQSQNEGENLTMILGKFENEIDYVKRQIEAINDQQDKLKETYTIYIKSLSQSEHDLNQLQQERQAVQLEANSVKKLRSQTATVIQKLEQEIADRLQTQLSLEKGTQSTKRDGSRLRSILHEKQSNIANIQNELSNVKLESWNITGRLRDMKTHAAEIDADMAEKNIIIEKYELEIRRRNDELGKKASEMDFLNKKYNQVTGGNEEEHMGPLEATVHNLQKSVQTKEQECVQLQQLWLRTQNELVAMTKTSLEITDETQSLKMRQAILSRKKLVVDNAFESEEKEIRENNRVIKQLQIDMVKINTLLSKKLNAHGQLEESNLELEQEFRSRLKQAELESIQLEHKVDELKSEKSRALTGLIEAERQIMLWEKKIQLAKETQAALDPNIGATEIREMGLEIHRMKLRYASMLKLQEKMISEMEKSVHRRDSISSRGMAKGKGTVQISLQKAIIELTKKIKQTIQDVEDCHIDIQSLERSRETMAKQIEEANESIQILQKRAVQLHEKIADETATKTIATVDTLIEQRHYRRYQDLRDGKYKSLDRDQCARALESSRALEKLERVRLIVQSAQHNLTVETKPLMSKLADFLSEKISSFQ